ncbi:MAG: YraN family protein [Acidimicrobiia bacterium]|nr:YraN family protein [Acidimicrobiia bacterium]
MTFSEIQKNNIEQKPKSNNKIIGNLGEEIACKFYLSKGCEIIARNVYISKIGEIDIIVRHTTDIKDIFVFAEVKTRSSDLFGSGYEAISYHKKQRMRRCAQVWIQDYMGFEAKFSWRLDVVSIDLSTKPISVRLFKNI